MAIGEPEVAFGIKYCRRTQRIAKRGSDVQTVPILGCAIKPTARLLVAGGDRRGRAGLLLLLLLLLGTLIAGLLLALSLLRLLRAIGFRSLLGAVGLLVTLIAFRARRLLCRRLLILIGAVLAPTHGDLLQCLSGALSAFRRNPTHDSPRANGPRSFHPT